MKVVRWRAVFLVLVIALFHCHDVSAKDPIYKLARGIANVAFGPMEVPMKIFDETRESGGIAGATYGTLNGVAFFLAREAVGIVDIVTFPIPLPGCPNDPYERVGWGYGQIANLGHEWVVPPSHNYFNIFYDDSTMMMIK